MTGVAVEQMLELWCVELRQVKAHLKSLFAHPSIGTSAAAWHRHVWMAPVWQCDC